jgi:hypothetical protein
MRARARACLGPSLWLDALVEQLARTPRIRWARLSPDALASWIERSAPFQAAWTSDGPPRVRRYILRPATVQQAPPLALQEARLPLLPTSGDVAKWLGLSPGALWRLTVPAAWQRRRSLGEQHYAYRWRRKARGGWRLLEAPHDYLGPVQRKVLHGLLDKARPHEAAHGGVIGRSALTHAQAHAGQPIVWRFDLQDFFGSVRASRVHAMFRTLGYATEVCRALTALCTTATPEPVLLRLREDLGGSWAHAQRLRDAHLPQGAPTSLALANLCAFGLDLRLDALARQWGARYTRYVDDLVFSGGADLRAASDRFALWVARIVGEEGFALNHRKTGVTPRHRQQRVAGIVVNERVNIMREQFDLLKATLHRHAVHGVNGLGAQEQQRMRAHLLGRIAWVAQLNPTKADRLRRIYARNAWPALASTLRAP